MTIPHFDIIVIGAGISGLTFARQAAETGLSTLVLERATRPGGAIRSERTADGYWFELGAHTLYNSYGALLSHIEALGVKGLIRSRTKVPYRLLVDGKLRSIPSQINKGELFSSVWRAFTARKQGKSVREYYGQLVGQANWKKVFSPLLSAVPSQRADDFPADMLFKKRERRKDIPRSFTLEGGLGALVDGFATAPGLEIRTSAHVDAISRRGGQFTVTFGDGQSCEATSIALAVPPDEGARLLAPLLPDVAAKLGQIRMATIESQGAVLRKEDLPMPKVAGIIPLEDDFFSIVSRDVLPHEDFRAATFHFRKGLSPEARLSRMETVLGVSRARFLHTADHAVSLPSPTQGHAELVTALDTDLKETGIYLTGNYFGGLAIEDCALRSRKEAERLIRRNK